MKKIHVFSDSPATQYRQKNNFYMFQKRCSDYGLQLSTWNFFEASHGKGPADGVGGAIKRQLDNQIAHGYDITNAKDAYDYLKSNTKVKIFYVPENEVEDMMKKIPNNVEPIKGTMKVHQIATNVHGSIKYKAIFQVSEATNLKIAMKENTEKSYKNKDESETEDVEDLATVTKEKNINKYDGHIEELKGKVVKNDVNIGTENNQKNEIYEIGDTVLARYYKKSWKYYVGVITKIHCGEKKYSISYYKSRGKKINVIFYVPKI